MCKRKVTFIKIRDIIHTGTDQTILETSIVAHSKYKTYNYGKINTEKS